MKPEKLVLIGNGMAGVRTLEELLKLAPNRYEITVFGAEPYGNYNRILLSPVLAAEKTIDEIMLNDEQWYRDNGITLHKGKQVSRIDRVRRRVVSEDGRPLGHIRGVYGERRNGNKVFFGKYINTEGHFQGILRGTYGEGSFQGRWLTRAGERGSLMGRVQESDRRAGV